MAKFELRRKSLDLRKQGKSYSQIKLELGVSKSTLSLWLRQYPLTKEQIRLLRDISEVRIEKYRQTMQRKRDQRLTEFYNKERAKYLPLSQRELFIAGLFLYWGEGGKNTKWPLSVSNTDPKVIRFVLFWYKKILKLPSSKMKVQLQLYSDMNVEEELKFWRNELKLPLSQFGKPYIKKSTRTNIDHKGGFGHGTCGLVVSDIRIKERVLMALKAIADYYSARI